MSLQHDPQFFRHLANTYRSFTGKDIAPPHLTHEEAARWLYNEAPFGVLAHNAEPDPLFIYGNRTAQAWFGYGWEELVALPSRLSAAAPDQAERQRFFQQVQQHGFISGYSGIRIAKSGSRFWIEDATVWQLKDKEGKLVAEAALLPHKSDITT